MPTEETPQLQVRIDLQNLYREEVFTDLKVASIRQLTPVKANGEIDKGRKILFFGQTRIMTPHGALPIQFPIEARNLQQAADKFPETMNEFIARMVAEAEAMQRQEQSRIVVPNAPLSEGRIILK
ncbi:MAG TPA: hypothetical protein PK836_03370 [Syntrophales bacterium]|nr:hypothetical protein [Syntrophales bacterium]HOM06592.1 hypothetical protein [Syntrophales bacterium]HON99625.1 hypothetical protein [Syntrophales bacterium]HPC00704.1 hypothetical protein [Syntrophales bacterium]HPQ06146.1 hypothetical protein [Syntrophales bacterium]